MTHGSHRVDALQLIPKRQSSTRGGEGGGGGGGGGSRGLGDFFGGLGRHLQAVTETAGGLLNECGIGAPPRPAGGRGEGNWTEEWMKSYAPALEDLRLSEMSLPGTHDSGTEKMVRFSSRRKDGGSGACGAAAKQQRRAERGFRAQRRGCWLRAKQPKVWWVFQEQSFQE